MTRPVFRIAILVLLLAACSRPEVDVPREEGKAGMFCVTRADCGPSLSCLEQRCCAKESCAATCTTLLEGSVSGPSLGSPHAATVNHTLRRRCLTLCCSGKPEGEIKALLGDDRGSHEGP